VTNYVYVEGPLDAILHFASPASPVDYLEKPIQTLKVGSLGTHKALGSRRRRTRASCLASTSSATAIRSSTRRTRTTGGT
jgi:dTDP-glucose 4,6-dehydratase